jgi:hypothetical protein
MVAMKLEEYFTSLIDRLEESEIGNNGKDKDGFFMPKRAVLLQKLSLLRDLYANPGAKPMVQDAWRFVSENLPAEWLVLDSRAKAELKKVLA